ncbi:hypothetical protein [Mycobacterium sp.]|uniref:hypothetical protein n=1 Tax=Mycobacterium sp. TaxID=1785 RepID=UPI002BE79D4F|nr:hypothetical protein [Mycobacterium sp.]HKP44572.1 hypothetical protein [Mycobacterium sp.]
MTTVYSMTRVEPVCRGGDPGRGLAATVEDPFWMLARQRQFGELSGEDAGSPVQVTFVQTETPFDCWRPAGGVVLPYSPQTDVVEALVAGEAAGPAHSTRDRIQAGRALAAAVPATVNTALLHAFPVPLTDDSPRRLVGAARLFADGLAVAAAVAGAAGAPDSVLATALSLAVGEASASRSDLEAFADWCRISFGTGPASWIPERLERRFELGVGDASVIGAPGHTRERVDWSDFDVVGEPGAQATPTVTSRKRIPTTIQFPGMPRNRFWEFEDSKLALSRIDASTTDLSRLALVEFSTIYGNDWFTFPLPVTYGSTQSVTELVVRDTFGTHELIAPAADQQWAMFRPVGSSIADPILVLPAVTASPLAGEVVEEVRFLRDEMANLVWGVEQLVTDAEGDVHDLPDEYVRAAQSKSLLLTESDLAYRLMTDVPEHWIPFIPVRIGDASRQVGLVEAVLPRPDSLGDLVASSPRSTVLQELRGQVLPEEEVPTAGVVVRRRWFLARSADGGRHTWAARSVTTGRGEGASGLRFDVAQMGQG